MCSGDMQPLYRDLLTIFVETDEYGPEATRLSKRLIRIVTPGSAR